MFTTVALKGVLAQLAPEFKRISGRALALSFGPGGVAVARLRTGAVHDVVVATPAGLETLAAEDYVLPDSITRVARSRIGVAVRAGTPHPPVGTAEEFRQALLAARAVAYTDPATGASSGVHFAKLLERMGIAGEVNVKARLGSGGPVAEFLARGEADLAVQQICEHMLVPGVEVVGPVPPEFQSVTTLAAAVHRRAAAPEAARSLIGLMASPPVQAGLPAHGLDPA
jgi:molybdate transport system substrate-binding protein